MKKFISLFLVFSILLLSGNLYGKERKGADLIIQKTDGTQVWVELIAVKENSLLLLDRESGADVSIDISDIKVIRVKGKSKFLLGLQIGGLAGAAGSLRRARTCALARRPPARAPAARGSCRPATWV